MRTISVNLNTQHELDKKILENISQIVGEILDGKKGMIHGNQSIQSISEYVATQVLTNLDIENNNLEISRIKKKSLEQIQGVSTLSKLTRKSRESCNIIETFNSLSKKIGSPFRIKKINLEKTKLTNNTIKMLIENIQEAHDQCDQGWSGILQRNVESNMYEAGATGYIVEMKIGNEYESIAFTRTKNISNEYIYSGNMYIISSFRGSLNLGGFLFEVIRNNHTESSQSIGKVSLYSKSLFFHANIPFNFLYGTAIDEDKEGKSKRLVLIRTVPKLEQQIKGLTKREIQKQATELIEQKPINTDEGCIFINESQIEKTLLEFYKNEYGIIKAFRVEGETEGKIYIQFKSIKSIGWSEPQQL